MKYLNCSVLVLIRQISALLNDNTIIWNSPWLNRRLQQTGEVGGTQAPSEWMVNAAYTVGDSAAPPTPPVQPSGPEPIKANNGDWSNVLEYDVVYPSGMPLPPNYGLGSLVQRLTIPTVFPNAGDSDASIPSGHQEWPSEGLLERALQADLQAGTNQNVYTNQDEVQVPVSGSDFQDWASPGVLMNPNVGDGPLSLSGVALGTETTTSPPPPTAAPEDSIANLLQNLNVSMSFQQAGQVMGGVNKALITANALAGNQLGVSSQLTDAQQVLEQLIQMMDIFSALGAILQPTSPPPSLATVTTTTTPSSSSSTTSQAIVPTPAPEDGNREAESRRLQSLGSIFPTLAPSNAQQLSYQLQMLSALFQQIQLAFQQINLQTQQQQAASNSSATGLQGMELLSMALGIGQSAAQAGASAIYPVSTTTASPAVQIQSGVMSLINTFQNLFASK